MAKMSGIIPAVFTLRGICVEPDWRYIRAPRNVARAYWTGIRRCPSVNITISSIVARDKTAKTTRPIMFSLAINPRPSICGKPATIPPKIIIDTPLPIPLSVINSPIQTRKIVPATSDTIMAIVGNISMEPTIPPWVRIRVN